MAIIAFLPALGSSGLRKRTYCQFIDVCVRGNAYSKSRCARFTVNSCAQSSSNSDFSSSASSHSELVTPQSVSVILLAGGSGSRMKSVEPKQFLLLRGMTILEHSLTLFCAMPEVLEIVLVLASEYQSRFQQPRFSKPIVFADPGMDRQGSVANGVARSSGNAKLLCVHDSARPCVTAQEVRNVLKDAMEYGAAVLGVPSKATIKEVRLGDMFVNRTIPRETLWEVHTPQVVRPDILKRGFEMVKDHGWNVTDDVSIVEMMGLPVRITRGEYTNLKVTTPEDLAIADAILKERKKDAAGKGKTKSKSPIVS